MELFLFVLNGTIGEGQWCGLSVPFIPQASKQWFSLRYVSCNGLLKTCTFLSFIYLNIYLIILVNMHTWNVNLAVGSLWTMSSDLTCP